MALKMKNVIQAKAKEKQATSTGGSKPQLSQKSDEAEPMRTDEELSKLARFNLGGKGVSCCPVLGCRVSLFPVPVGSVLNTVPFVFGGRFFGCEVLAIQGEKATKKAVFEAIYCI